MRHSGGVLGEAAEKLNVASLVRAHLEAGTWILSRHALERMELRAVGAPEVEFVLHNGAHERERDQVSEKGTAYAFRGLTLDGKQLRVVIAFRVRMLVVTVIDLDASPDRGGKHD